MKRSSTILSVLAFVVSCVAIAIAVAEFVSRRRDMFDCCCDDDCDCDFESDEDCDCFDNEVYEDDLSFDGSKEEAVLEDATQQESTPAE